MPNEECHEFAKATTAEALPLLRTTVGAGVFLVRIQSPIDTVNKEQQLTVTVSQMYCGV